MNGVQRIHADQAENNLQSLFEGYNSSLYFLSLNEHVKNHDSEGDALMRDFFASHQNDISAISRVDERGIILSSFPVETSIGADISHQDHVRQMMETHDKVVSDVFTAVQGFRAIAYHVPVFSGSRFTGSIAILIPFDIVMRDALENIRVLKTGYAFVFNENGTILYSPYAGHTDRPVSEAFNASPSVQAFINQAVSEPEGSGSYYFGSPSAMQNIRKYDAVYKKIDIEDKSWTLVIATPEDEILIELQTFTRDFLLVGIIIIISLLIFAYYYVQARGILREEEKRKKIEAALRDSEQKYRMIVTSIQDVFYRTDREGTLIMMSQSGADLFGFDSVDEMIGKNVAESFYFFPDERDKLVNEIREKGSVKNYEITFKTKNGGLIYARTSSHLYHNERNEVMGIEGIIHDMTNETLTSTALRQAMKKLSLLNSITVSDIQNNFFSITGYLSYLKSALSDGELLLILEKIEKLTQKINQSLLFTREYQVLGTKPSSWQSLEHSFLFGISHTDLSTFKRSLDIKNIEVFADPLLEKVFFILAENLIHHSRATEFSLSHLKTDDSLLILFKDNGIGIPAGEKERIFERRPGTHNGTGLFFSREILGITNISLRECGNPGEGAVFEIRVPNGSFRLIQEE